MIQLIVLKPSAGGQRYFEHAYTLPDMTCWRVENGTLFVTEQRSDGTIRQNCISPSGWLECYIERTNDR